MVSLRLVYVLFSLLLLGVWQPGPEREQGVKPRQSQDREAPDRTNGAPLCASARNRQERAKPPTPEESLGHTLLVPLDHQVPHLGKGPLYYEFGAPFHPAKPTVFVLSDAQQFYVRKGSIAALQTSLFGEGVNVVGIVNRGATAEFIQATLDSNGKPDWKRAWRLFRSEQFVEDIEAVRRAVVGDRAKILLWGQSGGAMLVHQYLAKYGDHVLRAFTAAAVNPFLEGELGLNSDRFWEEIGSYDPSLQPLLQEALKRYADRRRALVMTLQRQNFFVAQAQLAAERAALIRALAAGDDRRFEEAQKQYQVPEITRFFDSPEGIPICVREFEFFYPSTARERLKTGIFSPNLENTSNFARPLVDLCEAGSIPAPTFDRTRLHTLRTEVFLLSGRWDHTVDYRTAIALASCYPHHHLFLAKDDHELFNMKKSGDDTRLMRAFLTSGLSSPEMRSALDTARPLRWNEL